MKHIYRKTWQRRTLFQISVIYQYRVLTYDVSPGAVREGRRRSIQGCAQKNLKKGRTLMYTGSGLATVHSASSPYKPGPYVTY